MCMWSFVEKRKIVNALVQIHQRSEDQADSYVLESFYDNHLTDSLMNENNQIIQGSRGTGKTHILHVIERKLENEHTHCIYIDCRMFGTNVQYEEDFNLQGSNRLNRFCQSFLESFFQKLFGFYSYQLEYKEHYTERIQNLLSKMKQSITIYTEEIDTIEQISRADENGSKSSTISRNISWPLNIGLSRQRGKIEEKNLAVEVKYNSHVRYPTSFYQFSHTLAELLLLTNQKIILLMDEWSSISPHIQPFFAEFLKKTLFPVTNIRFKIAITPQQKQFRRAIGANYYIGFEIGSDIQLALDLDSKYSVDADPEELISFCFRFLCKHLSVLLGCYVEPNEYIRNMFDGQKSAFMLVRAAEGNPRDFINLSFMCVQSLSDNILICEHKILSQSEQLYKTSKLDNCSESAQKLMNELIHHVVYTYENRGFLIDRHYLTSPALKSLIDARALHILKDGYMGYRAIKGGSVILILDFGAYCEALNYGLCINFFSSGDFMEKEIFPEKLYGLVSPQDTLPYDKSRFFYKCYINIEKDQKFSSYF